MATDTLARRTAEAQERYTDYPMLDGPCPVLESLADEWLALAGETEGQNDETETDTLNTLAELWDAAVDAGSARYRYPVTIREASYGVWDTLASAWADLAGATSEYVADPSDGLHVYDFENVGRGEWQARGWRTHDRTSMPLVWSGIAPQGAWTFPRLMVRTWTVKPGPRGTGWKRGGRPKTSSAEKRRADTRARVAAYRERQRLARLGAVVDTAPAE